MPGKPRALLVHGSATDSSTFGLLRRALDESLEVVTFDRRGAGGERLSVGDHARDAIAELDARSVVVGSSFGAVIGLEVARLAPERVAGVVAMEAPAPASALSPALPDRLGCLFEVAAAAGDGEAAAEVFVRAVLGDDTFERIPARFRQKTLGRWRAIRSDSRALADHDFATLSAIEAPVLLLSGERSPERFESSTATLHRLLPRSRCETIAGAGHMMHIEAAVAVAASIVRFAGEVV